MNSEKQLHFISMDVPFPPNYGGIIDVFFKLKAFNQSGVKIYLHLFGFKNERNLELEKYAEKVYFYPIKQNPFLVFNKLSKVRYSLTDLSVSDSCVYPSPR